MKSGYLTLLGFVMLIVGFLSIVFSMIGLQFTFLRFVTDLGPGIALAIQIVLLFGGMVLMYLSRMPADED